MLGETTISLLPKGEAIVGRPAQFPDGTRRRIEVKIRDPGRQP